MVKGICVKQKRHQGFTLVELIVVLVILAILAALLIPALTGYIDKARRQSIIAECRQSVIAAQAILSEKYSKDSAATLTRADDGAAVLSLAEISGTPTDRFFGEFDTDTGHLRHLYFQSGNYKVVYCAQPGGAGDPHTESYTVTNEGAAQTFTKDTLNSLGTSIGDALQNAGVPSWSRVDSGAAAVSGSNTTKMQSALQAQGIDFNAMGATSWAYVRNSNASGMVSPNTDVFCWTTTDIQNLTAGTQVAYVQYSCSYQKYTVRKAAIITNTIGGVTYNTLRENGTIITSGLNFDTPEEALAELARQQIP